VTDEAKQPKVRKEIQRASNLRHLRRASDAAELYRDGANGSSEGKLYLRQPGLFLTGGL
jgi:hypothetical protein